MTKKSKLRLQIEEMCEALDWILKSCADWGGSGWRIILNPVDLIELSELIDDDSWHCIYAPNLDEADKLVSALYALPDRQEALEALGNLFDISFK